MAKLVVSQVNDQLFVHRAGLTSQVKALWFLLWHCPMAFIIGMDIAIRIMANPGKVALFIVIQALPEWREKNAQYQEHKVFNTG